MTKRGTVSTNNIILTFDSTDLPSEIRVGYVKVRVRPFVPAPMRCFRCQRFGHTKDNCRGRPTCSKCASQDHTDETCDSETPRCVNCGEGQTPHSAYDRSCPAYVKEKEIMTIKATRNLSFKEAREVYNQSHPKTSYAQKVPLQTPLQAVAARVDFNHRELTVCSLYLPPVMPLLPAVVHHIQTPNKARPTHARA
ncbi:Nucleic-acid-binding protein from mobile element jockey [Amphibalanus amphitrite]|uniref:Nucleic-acid-binding protein from mobile element jockey n=1 Tax=Amphibalanus amphitrite TaxID=1232801 RepID=A0A6A4W2B0_AMPAM|nr:Nucleic-acid-binding protein from mobile element jockey [Amphibalanus amphitrite]